MENLEKQFNLGPANPDQGGGILYCMRYSSEHIEEHRAQVLAALKDIGLTFKDHKEGIAVEAQNTLSPEDEERTLALLEELSVINEAEEYIDAGLDGVKNIKDLYNRLVLSFMALLDKRNLVDAYNFVTVFIPTIVSDIWLADQQNHVLSAEDRRLVEELASFAQSKEKMLNNNRSVILGGTRF
jgi:hypothetical protein